MDKKIAVFSEFLIMGVILGIIEDVIIIKIVTHEPITIGIFLIIFAVTLPFAFIGEYIVDQIDFIKKFGLNKRYKKIEVFLEFLIFGIFVGIFEDLITFYFATGEKITLNVLLITFCVAVPFAFLSEVIIDRIKIY